MKIKVMESDGTIRLADRSDLHRLLLMRDLLEFSCEAEELYATDQDERMPVPKKKERGYNWKDQEVTRDLSPLCDDGDDSDR